MPSTRPDRAACRAPQSQSRKGLSQEYRLMVEAIQSGDLAAARDAYGAMMERLGSAATDGALARIGASLRHGDLAAANRTLDALESRALRVLRGLRELTDLRPPSAVPRPVLRRPN